MEDSQFQHNELSFKPQTSSYLLRKPLHHSAYEVHVHWLQSLQFLPHLYSKKLRKHSSFKHTQTHLDSVSLWRQIIFCEHQIYPNLCSDENPHFSHWRYETVQSQRCPSHNQHSLYKSVQSQHRHDGLVLPRDLTWPDPGRLTAENASNVQKPGAVNALIGRLTDAMF